MTGVQHNQCSIFLAPSRASVVVVIEKLVQHTLPQLIPAIRLRFGSNVVIDLFAALTTMFDPSDPVDVGLVLFGT